MRGKSRVALCCPSFRFGFPNMRWNYPTRRLSVHNNISCKYALRWKHLYSARLETEFDLSSSVEMETRTKNHGDPEKLRFVRGNTEERRDQRHVRFLLRAFEELRQLISLALQCCHTSNLRLLFGCELRLVLQRGSFPQLLQDVSSPLLQLIM